MTIAAKHFDPQLGIDIHTYLIPPSPIPIPLPTPHIGIVLDPFDYIPVIGGTINVNGVKRATAGCMGLDLHIPVGGAWMPTLKMPMGPQWDDEIFMGSRTVLADGDPFSRVAMPVLACNIVGMVAPFRARKPKRPKLSLLLPTTVNLAIPSNVYVGGAPTVSWTALAMGAGLAGLGKLMKKTGLSTRAADAFRKLRQNLFGSLPPGFLKCNVLRAEPVDIRDGSVSVTHEDFAIPGRLPLTWSRHYRSHQQAQDGVCGHGWQTPADIHLELYPDGSVLFVDVESAALFPQLPAGEGNEHAVRELVDGARLSREGGWLWVRTKEGLRYGFAADPAQVASLQARALPIECVEDLCGNRWHYERRDGHLLRIVESGTADAAGNALQGRFIEVESRQGRIERMTLHDPATGIGHPLVRYAYDPAGDLTAAIDPLEAARTFEYVQHRMVRHTDRVGLSFHYAYNAQWQVIHAWGDGGLYDYRFRYDGVLNETEITDSLGHVSIIKFDENRLPLCEIDPLDGVTVFEYDEVGRTTAVIDPLGLRTQFDYDERGNLLKLARPDGSTLTQVFDEDDRLLARTRPGGGTERFEWNTRGLLAASVGASGGTHRFDYTGHGQLCAATDPRGGTTRFEFDRYGKLCVQIDALGMRQRLEHDGLGRTLRRWDGSGGATSYTHDAKGRLLRMDFPGGEHVACEYDAEGRLVRYRDPSGALTRLEYTGVDLLRKRIQPDGTATEYLYDTEGRLQSLINPNGERYQLLRDARGCVVEEVDYWGQRQHYELDAGGRIRRRTDALGRSVEFRLDAMGRITRKRHADPFEPARVLDETFRYDAGGRLLEARNAAGHVLRKYDAEGRVVHEEQNGFVVASSYDAFGNRVQRISDAGNRVVFDYDQLGRSRAVEVNGEPGIETVRNLHGQTVAERLGEALVRGCRYDGAGLLAIQALLKDDAELFRTEYDYDTLGDPVARTDSEYGRDAYAYDLVRRVIEHAGPVDGMRRWATDRAGNRLHTRVLQAKRQAVVGSDLQVDDDWSREGDLDGVHYAFDRAGNLARRQLRGGSGQPVMHLRWDAEQRLVECAWSEGERQGMRVRFGYDPLGRRVFKRGPKETTWFFWDGDALLGEVTQANDEPDAAPLWVGNVANLHEAQQRRRRLKALHGQVREYVYRPGGHEPLMLIEVESAAEDQAPLSREAPALTPASVEDAELASAATPEGPRAGAGEASVTSTAPVSIVDVPAPHAVDIGVSVAPHGLGFGVRLGADSAEPAQAEGDALAVRTESTRPAPSGLGLGGRLSALALGSGRSESESTARDADALESAPNPAGARALAAVAGSSQVWGNGPLQATEPAAAANEIAASSTTAGRADPSPQPATRRVVYHFCNDLNGCPVRIVDATGQVVWGATHTPWGQVRALSTRQRLINPIRQQGQYFDRETGLCYNLARYYDPHAGCYVSADPLGLAAGENTYLYVFGNPFAWADPWGLGACRRGEWIFPEGGPRNVNDYDKIYTNGIMGDRATAQALANQQGVAYYYNPSFKDGLPKWVPGFLKGALGGMGDVFETGIQKFGKGNDPLTQGFIDGLKQLDHPVTIVAHSQGAATLVRSAAHIPAGSTVVLRSPAISYDTAKQALDGIGLQEWKYIQPVGDIAPLYASNGPGQWWGQVRKINPRTAVDIHNQNGLGLGTGDFPGDVFGN